MLNDVSKEKITDYLNNNISWNNSDNIDFYKKISLKYFKHGAAQVGIDTGCDVDIIFEYLTNATSILEIGSGYGRVLEYVINKGFNGKLFAVEREPKLCRYLKKKYADKATIINADIRQIKIERKFDAILWMWTGIAEFSKPEQLLMIHTLASYLNRNGIIIIDTIPIEAETINTADFDQHNRIIIAPHGFDYGYIPSSSEIKGYCKKAGLLQKHFITYITKTGKNRSSYILQKTT